MKVLDPALRAGHGEGRSRASSLRLDPSASKTSASMPRTSDKWHSPEYKRAQRRRKAEQEGRPLNRTYEKGFGTARARKAAAFLAWQNWMIHRAPAWWLVAFAAAADERQKQSECEQRRRDAERQRRVECAGNGLRSAYYRARKSKLWARRKAQSDGTLPLNNWTQILRGATACAYCSVKLTAAVHGRKLPTDATLDHVHPLALGGIHGVSNVLVVCASCNFSKGSKLMCEWLPNLPSAVARHAEEAFRKLTTHSPPGLLMNEGSPNCRGPGAPRGGKINEGGNGANAV